MNGWEIEIYNMTDDDMITITDALHAAQIDDAGDGDIGAYLVYNKPTTVRVAPMQVGAAVEVINALGFQTDEDQHDDDN